MHDLCCNVVIYMENKEYLVSWNISYFSPSAFSLSLFSTFFLSTKLWHTFYFELFSLITCQKKEEQMFFKMKNKGYKRMRGKYFFIIRSVNTVNKGCPIVAKNKLLIIFLYFYLTWRTKICIIIINIEPRSFISKIFSHLAITSDQIHRSNWNTKFPY